MKTKFKAVLHVTVNQPAAIANLGTRVISKLTLNAALYTSPDPTVGSLTTENNLLIQLNAEAKGSTQKKNERDAQAVVVYGMLNDELVYVNEIADGDKVKVDKSGFDSEKEPEAHDIPATPVIKRMDDGKLAHSGKIFLVGPLAEGLRYSVQAVNLDSDGPNPMPIPIPGGGDFDWDSLDWSTVLESLNSTELVVLNLKRGKDIAFRVRAEDGSKKSKWSDPYFFMSR